MYPDNARPAADVDARRIAIDRAYTGAETSAPAPTTIPVVLNANDEALSQLHSEISGLEDALMFVLCAEKPTGGGAVSARPDAPNLLDRVIRQNEGLLSACSRINNIRRRLQL